MFRLKNEFYISALPIVQGNIEKVVGKGFLCNVEDHDFWFDESEFDGEFCQFYCMNCPFGVFTRKENVIDE